MTKARLDGLYLLLLGSVIFMLLGAALERNASAPMLDFRALYYPARCLLQHRDPYNETEVMKVYQAEGVYGALDTAKERQMATRFGYLPTTFSFTLPFAMLSWGPSYTVWMAVTAGSLILASLLIWSIGANYAPIISGCLIGFLLANSELLLIEGMCAGIAVSLCAIAVWCFIRGRFIPIGVFCLAFSLAIKPQDTGLVWIYFLLAGKAYRKHALQTLLATIALSLPMVIWVWHVSPHWIQELHSNVIAFSAHGGINDPGLTSTGAHGIGMVISLQAVISVFCDDPRVYDTVSYLIFAPLFLLWAFTSLRSHDTADKSWLALAAIAALSMLPVYHRQYDAKLILLTVPACAMLWREGGVIGWLSLLISSTGLMLTGDLPWAILLGLISHFHPSATGISAQLLMAVQVFPAPIILLVIGVFYLWVYVRRCSEVQKPHQDFPGMRI